MSDREPEDRNEPPLFVANDPGAALAAAEAARRAEFAAAEEETKRRAEANKGA